MSIQDELTPSIKPGDDFYSFVNQKWCDAHPIPADKPRVSALSDLDETVIEQLHELLETPLDATATSAMVPRRLATQFYAAGMDEAAIEARGLTPVLPLVHEIEQLAQADDVAAYIMRTHGEGQSLVWRLNLDVDERDSRRYVMTIAQSGLLLPNRDYYFEASADFKKIRTAYKRYLTQLFEALELSNIAQRVAHVYQLEEKLAAASNTATENRDVEALYNPITFADLPRHYRGFDWQAYQQVTGLGELQGLIVHQPAFLAEAVRLIATEPVEAWRDYLIAQMVSRYLPHLSAQYEALHFDFFDKVLAGTEQQQARYKRIIRITSAVLPEPIGQLYIEAHFDTAAKQAITDLVQHIQQALRERLQRLEWMSAATKQQAFKKLDTFLPLLGYPDTWRSYEGLQLGNDYVANLRAVQKFEWRYDVARVMRPVDRREWLMSPAAVNAYYWPNTNGITFPAAILQPPLFDPKGDIAANYGAIGAVIGHEITHGFDDSGAKYDEVGNLNSWWQDSDQQAFEARTQALVRQYDTYTVNGQHVKGQLTLGENIADLGGVLIAYDALQAKLEASGDTAAIDGLTPAQRFFLAHARVWRTNIRPELALQFLVRDPHSPAHLRVNGVVTNIDAWYDAWNVEKADALYKPPNKRLRIW